MLVSIQFEQHLTFDRTFIANILINILDAIYFRCLILFYSAFDASSSFIRKLGVPFKKFKF